MFLQNRISSLGRFFLILVIILCFGCSAKESSESETPQSKNLYSAVTKKEAKELIIDADLSCSDQQNCNASVGIIGTITKKDGLFSVLPCSASLVSDEVVMTASHCIPENIHSGDQIEPESIFFKLPSAQGYSFDVFEVDQVLERSTGPFNGTSLDYAFVRLNRKTFRKHLVIKPQEIADLSVYSMVRIHFAQIKNKIQGTQQTVECSSSEGSLYFPYHFSPNSPVVSFHECNTEPGNSGAPVLDKNGFVVGVIESVGESLDEDYAQNRLISSFNLKEDDITIVKLGYDGAILGQFTFATRLGCVPYSQELEKYGIFLELKQHEDCLFGSNTFSKSMLLYRSVKRYRRKQGYQS